MLPYVFVGDEVFTLTEDFMNPYNVQKLTKERRIFNYRLSHAQRITENVFIISETKLGIFKLILKFSWAILRIQSWLAELHSFLSRISPEMYTPSTCFVTENLENGTVLRTDPIKRGNNEKGKRLELLTGKETIYQYEEYFNNEGKVPRQAICT